MLWEIYWRTTPMHIRLHKNIHPSDAVEGDFLVLVVAPVAHARHVHAVGLVFFVAFKDVPWLVDVVFSFSEIREKFGYCEEPTFRKNNILLQRIRQLPPRIGFLPGIVVEAPLDIHAVHVAMEPDIYNHNQESAKTTIRQTSIIRSSP